MPTSSLEGLAREHRQTEIVRCQREIAAAEAALLAGHPDVPGLCLALSDWSAELRILAQPNNGVPNEHYNECRR